MDSNINKLKIKKEDYEYLNDLKLRLKKIQIQYKQDWSKYCYESSKQYDERYNLAPKRDADGKIIPPKHQFGYEPMTKFELGKKVLYYVGPNQGTNGKWRQRWTGPWRIANRTGKYTVKILDLNGKSYNVSIDRLKLFKTNKNKQVLNPTNYNQTLRNLSRHKPDIKTMEIEN